MNNNTDGDSWGQLLSDFGIENAKKTEPTQTEPLQTQEPDVVAETFVIQPERSIPEENVFEPADDDGFGAGLLDAPAETSDEPAKTKEKKSIFSRFPKVNFFGAPPQVSLDSVIEGVKSPSLGGKGFTDNKLEKMPLSHERTNRQKKNAAEESNTWSVVASQIETLANGKESPTKSDERPSKRHISSMFDDPIPESEESRALKNLMGEPAPRERKNKNDFLERESDNRRDRGHRQPTTSEERGVRGRGAKYKPPVEVDDLPESDFEPLDNETSAVRGRGRGRRNDSRYERRESRYEREPVHENNEPMEEWSEVDAALQADQERPTHRGGRYRQEREQRELRDRRPERSRKPAVIEQEPMDDEDHSVITAYGNVPDWDEAIGDIVSGNIARHKSSSHRGRR